jgi:hypothetical protein
MSVFVILITAVFGSDISYEVAWVWGEPIPEEAIWGVNQMGNPKSSYIRLDYDRNRVMIDMVKIGGNWDRTYPFCKEMLPATMQSFIQMHYLTIGRNLTKIEVYNAAVPREAGCRCYVRVMMKFGFRLVNGFIIENGEDLGNFCSPAYLTDDYKTLVGEILVHGGDQSPDLSFSPLTRALMESAHVHYRIGY